MRLNGKSILLGLTGGVACYKTAELTRLLRKEGASVRCVMSEAATHFITPTLLQALSGQAVFTQAWDERIDNHMPHIELSRAADLLLIAPASADFLRKLAQGAADDLLSSLCLARRPALPLCVAPAMNVEMWLNPATQRNVTQLQADGIHLLGPAAGEQACGDQGPGRMLEPAALLEEILAHSLPKPLLGRRVLLTAGPTFEPIDPVRGITNRSSGKMGYALALAAWQAGAEVVLVSGPTALSTPYGCTRIDVLTAHDMQAAVRMQLAQFHPDIFIAVAAVADWRVAEISPQKIKKSPDAVPPGLHFVNNPDILAEVAALPNAPYCVGFAAESEALLEHAAAKRRAKNVPLLVGNIGHHTFGQDDNEIVLFDAEGHTVLPRARKDVLATHLVHAIATRLTSAPSAP